MIDSGSQGAQVLYLKGRNDGQRKMDVGAWPEAAHSASHTESRQALSTSGCYVYLESLKLASLKKARVSNPGLAMAGVAAIGASLWE